METLTYEVRLIDGSALPPELKFDTKTFKITGKQPKGVKEIKMVIKATDSLGHSAETVVTISLHRDTSHAGGKSLPKTDAPRASKSKGAEVGFNQKGFISNKPALSEQLASYGKPMRNAERPGFAG